MSPTAENCLNSPGLWWDQRHLAISVDTPCQAECKPKFLKQSDQREVVISDASLNVKLFVFKIQSLNQILGSSYSHLNEGAKRV